MQQGTPDTPSTPGSSRPRFQSINAGPASHVAVPHAYVPYVLFAILLLAIGLRLTVLALGPAQDAERAMAPDSKRYVELASNIVHYGTFGLVGEKAGQVHIPLEKLRSDLGQLPKPDANGLRPEAFRTPGYALYLAAFIKVGLSLPIALIGQCILSTIGVLLVFAIANELLASPRIALVAAAIVALHPGDITLSVSLLSETLFTTLLLAGLWFALRHESHLSGGALGGLALGFSVLVRPISVLLGPVIAVWSVLTRRTTAALLPALGLAAASMLPAFLWAERNSEAGLGRRVSTVAPVTNYFYTAAFTRINADGGDTVRDWPSTVDAMMNQLRANTKKDEDVFSAMDRLALDEIKQHPDAYSRGLSRGTVKLFTDHSLGDLYTRMGFSYQPSGLREKMLGGKASLSELFGTQEAGYATAWTVWNLLLGAMMLLGLATLALRRRWSALVLLTMVIGYFAFATQLSGLERFRVPMLGFQAIASASAFMLFAPGPKKDKKVKPDARKQAISEVRAFLRDTDNLDAPRPEATPIPATAGETSKT